MFQIKVCGITNVADALMVVRAGADAIGLNFYPPSPRYVSVAKAKEIAGGVPEHVASVGVFVNASTDTIHGIADHVPLDFIQLHGDEPPELLSELPGYSVIRAFRVQSKLDSVAEYLAECENGPAAILIDACVPRQYGGTGQTVDWHVLQPQRVLLQRLPLILAGGLGSDNVAQAISIMRPTAVDVASGVESEPGRKDADLVHRFVTAARAAFSSK